MFKKKEVIFFIVFILILLASFLTSGFRENPFLKPEKTRAVKRAIEFIKTQVPPKAEVKLKEAKEMNGLYYIKFLVEKKEFEAYVDKKGELLFPSAISLKKKEMTKTDKPKVELFTMSFCPFGNQAEEIIEPVLKLLGNYIEFEPHYVIYSNYGKPLKDFCFSEKGEYCSMHGKQELHQDIREHCVFKYEREKYLSFVDEINKKCNYKNVDECWLGIAKSLKIDTQKISDCFENEAVDFLKSEVALNKEYKITASPTLVINGEIYEGRRSSNAYKEAICSAFKKAPKECRQEIKEKGSNRQGSCQ